MAGVMALFVYHSDGSRAQTYVVVAPTLIMLSALLMPFAGGQQGTLEQYNLSLSVQENSQNGTRVGEVTGAQFRPPYAKWMPQATDNRTINSFNVDVQTGWITTKGELDREEQEHHTIIISTSFMSPKLVIVDIRVLDVNDVTPTFPNPFLNFSIPESAPKDHKIPLGSVRDEDLGENTTQKVEIVSGNEENDFLLQIKNSSNVDKILDLVVNTYQLDYERTSTYNLVIRATDGGGRYSEMRVNINMIDQNDNEPIFNTSKYSAKITENVTVGTLIIQVHATDIDSGENRRISYSIDPRSDPEEYFTINATTGWVKVNKPLDYETRDRFSLTLEARDNGVSPQMGTAALDVIIENINEQPANITLQFLPRFRNGHVQEDTPKDTLLAMITVNDPDIDVSSDVEVSLYNSDGYFTLKKVSDQLGIYVNSGLDRETVPSFEMSLQVTDNGNPPLRANKVFKVVIDDVNDNPPIFEKSEYVAAVDETAEVGKLVLKVSATDKDAGANARITYHIQEGSQHMGWFTVDSSTGAITTRSTMDCDLSPQPVLVVVATDGGDPPQVGSAQVTVTVRDVNDKEPEFETSFYSIKLAENRRVGDCILTVSATDPECGTNSPVTYKMARMQAPPKEFRVNANTGDICVESELDHEVTSSYQFQVEAIDTDGMSTQAVVQVEVTDVNDNHPRFEPREYPINVMAGVFTGQLVIVQARDKDSGIFGTVTYSITEGNDQSFFSINTNTGAIAVRKVLPEGMFSLKVLATDGGGLTSLENGLVTVSAISGNVHPPIFTPTMFNFTISEAVGVGQIVGQVQANLDDTGGTMEITYSSLFQTVDWFSINNRTGSIYTKSGLDRELNSFVVISIQAWAGFPPVYAVAQVNVTILDVNDNEPYFPATTMLELEVREDEAAGTALYIARAHDRDAGNNGTVRYRLHNQPSDTFAINDQTGQINLVKQLDYERHREYLLLVVAEDLGTPMRLSSNMTLTVKVKDVNDNAPKFDRAMYDFYVAENVPIGHSIDTVTATDDDSDHNKRISFSLKNNRYDSIFGISPVEGTILTRDVLDRELREMYELTVEAVDHGSPVPLSATALIRIIVTDINDNEPVFSRDEYRFSIRENLEYNSLVGQVVAQDKDSGSNGQLQFFFSGPQTNFTINSQNGEIRTQVSLDREVMAEHIITVYVSDKGEYPKSSITKVKIKVEDDNDNDPTFQRQGPISVSVFENRSKGTDVITLVAVDPDEGDNGLVSYFFDKDRSEAAALTNFEIHPRSGQVSTREVLDYETQTIYHLTVVARDNGRVFRQTSQPITISVLDANDQAPLFHARHVSFDCVENVSIGTVAGQVKATDRDSGDNGKVNYYLVGGNVFSSFSVNRTSGVITTVREIDYEEASTHTLSIQAVDSSTTLPRSSNISVTINIIDVNDNAPVFEQDPVIIRTVAENTPKAHVLHKFIATDRDSGVNGTVQYSIESYSGQEEGYGPYFNIRQETGELYVSGNIDFEKVDQISVIVKAQDKCPYKEYVQRSLMTTIIFVTDVNDNAPQFESTDNLVVSEEEAIGYMILVVVAVDQDSNIDTSGNNIVRYQIVSGNEEGKFLLGSDTGYLSIYDALDHETQTNYTLNISAEDSGIPKMVSHQRLQITVTDTNDNAPVFKQSVYHANVSENSSPQTFVIKIQAFDADTGENGALTYQIPTGIAGDMFAMDSQTGVLTTKVQLDRETKDSYTVTAYVKDGAYPVHYSSCSIIIHVTDQNDNAPTFKNQQYSIQIPENRAQISVLTLVASDRDLGENARVTYAITGGNDGNFSIDPNHGDITTEPLDRETRSTYNLTITASDHGNNSQTATAYVVVVVLDENDNSPTFNELVYSVSVPEDTEEGKVVLNVTARDPDLGQNGQVMYSLGNDTDGYFEINSQTGEVYTSGVFDREKVSNYSFVVIASDNGVSGPRNSSTRILITISDINDNAPIFSMVPYTVNLNLSTPPNTHIMTVTARDPDLGNNGLVEYSFQASTGSSDIMQYLIIDRTSGRVSTNNSLLRASGHYSVLVVATDSATSPPARLSSTGVIEITVGSGDSNLFQFSRSEYTVEIPEHFGRGNSVVNVTASFVSAPQPSQSTMYIFASGNENNAFRISNRTGQITVADPAMLDYETTHRIRVIVTAVNGNYHAYATVWINLSDINDNKPKFSQARYVSAIWENNQPETYVTQVVARDADSGLNGDIIYSIIGGNDDQVFTLAKPHTGIVVTSTDAAPLDREAQPDGYRLTIEARDRGNSSKFSTCVLVINIVDENDTPPFFPEIGPKNVSENRDVGYTVVMATANDVDLNPILVYDFTTDGNPDNTFSLDRSTGRLTLAKRLDHEKKSHYSVGLQVTDGKPDHVRATWLDIYVDDENDNAPVFSQPNYQVALPEQTGPQQSIITVLATDPDSGRNAQITYSMAPTAVDSFYINSKTGTIYTNRTITFTSSQSIIQLVVVARDNGTIAQSSMVAVHIQITDVNKFTPRFLEPARYMAHIKESAQRGHEVLKVSAVDEDNSHRGDNINYTLIGPGSELFLIRQRTGNVFVNGAIDFEVRKQYDLTAVATDRGIPPKNASIPVTIIVDDENDNAPVFLEEKYSISLAEDTEALHVFLVVNASDADSGINAAIKFSITSGNSEGIFLNPHNEGGLMIMEGMHLDFESHQSHRLIIRAIDCNGCPQTTARLSAFVTVDIIVKDVNEFKPRFPVKHYLEDVLENSEVGTVVFRAHANDGDGGEMGLVIYSLMTEYDYQKFSIDALTGEVSTKHVFDYEAEKAIHLYNLTIIATDAGKTFDMADVTIRVVDRDEYDPILTAKDYSFEVPGSAKAGDIIGQVSASDHDGGDAGRLVYSFLKNSDYFGINPFTGNITVIVTLHDDAPKSRLGSSIQKRALTTDREELTIQVSSGQLGSRQDTAQCTISIDRTCPHCAAPVGKMMDKSQVEGGILAGIIVACLVVTVLIILGILFLVHRRRSTGKSVPNYSSDSTLDLDPPPQLPHDRTGYADIIRISCPPPNNHLVSDISDQSHNSASSGRGSAEAEEEDEEISRINSNSFLHSSQAFRQKAMPDSGIQHDDDTLSEPAAQTHQEYLANLGIDSSKIGKTKPVIRNNNHINNNNIKRLDRSAESMHQFSDEGGGEGGVDTDLEKMTDLETDDEAATLEVRTQVMSFHEPDTHNVGSLSSVINSEEVNGGSYNWDYLIDWGPQYQPLAHVFSEIAKLKDESVTPKKQPIKTVPQRQFSSSLKQPQVRTVPPPIITNAPPLSIPLTIPLSNNQNNDIVDLPHHSSPAPFGRNSHQPQLQVRHGLLHHNHSHHPNHMHQPSSKICHMPLPPPPQIPLSSVPHSSQYTANSRMFSPHHYPFPNTRSPQQVRHQQYHSPRMGIHPHLHPPPPQLPPPPIPQQQTSSSSSSRSHPSSAHASTMNISLPSLPRSPISYESSLTSAVMTPSLTPSLSPLATRSPSISPVVSSGHITPGKSNSRQNLTQRSSNTQSLSSGSEKEFTI